MAFGGVGATSGRGQPMAEASSSTHSRPVPLGLWPVTQVSAQYQRGGALPAAVQHRPAKMLPAVARTAISAYTGPGDVVVDPMCGIGTALVEAVHLGRDAIGVEYEPVWSDPAWANLTLARSQGASSRGEVLTGDARHLGAVVDPAVSGLVALVLTSPPYGAAVHGQVKATPGAGVAKSHWRYSTDRANLAHQPLDGLLGAMREILAGAARLLRPGGVVAMTVRPWGRAGRLIDLPGLLARAGEDAGLTLYERNVALLAGLRGEEVVSRASFFALDQVRRARARGVPRQVVAHEDLLVFRTPGTRR